MLLDDYTKYKSLDLIPCECEFCHKKFEQKMQTVLVALFRNLTPGRFCSRKCSDEYFRTKPKVQKIKCNCLECGSEVWKWPKDLKRYPKPFCNRICSANWNVRHRKRGSGRSKLEIWIGENLEKKYPTLDLLFNDRTVVSPLELDIYIPSLRLGFELNGAFHYEPIYSEEQLTRCQTNDKRKFTKCIEEKISLTVIDTSEFSYLKPERDKKYLDIITNIIDSVL